MKGAIRRFRALSLAVIVVMFASLFPTATATAAEVLCDVSFENPDGCWMPLPITPNGQSFSGSQAHSGAQSAEFCGFSPCVGGYGQHVTVPSGVASGTLSVWVYSHNPDANPDCDDFAGVQLSDSSGTDGVFAGECSEFVPASTWTHFSADVTDFLQAHRNETLDVIALGVSGQQEADDAHSTMWFVDDVSLDIVAGPAPTSHARTITLGLKRHLVAKGALTTDGYGPCVAGVAVKIQRRKADRWRTIKTTTTDELGTYRVKLPDRAGKYRAKAPAFDPSPEHVCEGTRSLTRRHSH